MLPCNIIIQQLDKNVVEVAAIDPFASMMAVENNELTELAKKVKAKLEKAISIID